ncbi:MAG: hypothetical protein M3347_06965 [Armatimonadota bacterium]|nr:hypothetical protein [Armatimonadota bacterium]
MRWTRKSIVEEIKRLHDAGEELNYTAAEANHLNLVRAAAWHFGTWRRAIQSAGIDYDSLSKYQRWNRERIVERIQELHQAGEDLSWRVVSTEIDPPLAAAALRPNGFPSWRDAITAAGLNIDEVARYKNWTPERVLGEIKALARAGHPLSSKIMQTSNQSLFCAARRRFGSWDNALVAAGLDVAKIRLRQPATKGGKIKRSRRSERAGGEPQLNGHQPARRGAAATAPPAKSSASKPPADGRRSQAKTRQGTRSGAAQTTTAKRPAAPRSATPRSAAKSAKRPARAATG